MVDVGSGLLCLVGGVEVSQEVFPLLVDLD